MLRRPRKDRYDVIVVGAGMGGLGAAIYLAQQGYSVLVAERHYRAGGYAHSFRRGKYTFDSAVRIVAGAENGLLQTLLDGAGLADTLPFLRLEETYSAYYPEHRFTVPASMDGFVHTYARLFPHEQAHIVALVREMEQIYAATLQMLQEGDPFLLLSHPLMMKYRTMTFHEMASHFISDPRAVYTIAALWCYYGTPPMNVSALYFSYAIMSYFKEGIYYLKGSFQTLADAFVDRIEACSGEVCLRQAVRRIVVEGKKVIGVELESGEFLSAPIVICNGDLTKMVYQLVGANHFPSRFITRLSRLTFSISAFEVFIGTDLPLNDFHLSHETFIYDLYDYQEIYSRHSDLRRLGVDGLCGLAISSPTLVDPSLSPPGKHTVILTTLVPYDLGRPWREVKSSFQEALIRMSERALPGLRQHLDFVESGSPETMERYTQNSQGAIYGWDQNMRQMISRPQHELPIQGLYLCGHWTDPGGGVVSVLLSAYKLFQKITRVPDRLILKGGL